MVPVYIAHPITMAWSAWLSPSTKLTMNPSLANSSLQWNKKASDSEWVEMVPCAFTACHQFISGKVRKTRERVQCRLGVFQPFCEGQKRVLPTEQLGKKQHRLHLCRRLTVAHKTLSVDWLATLYLIPVTFNNIKLVNLSFELNVLAQRINRKDPEEERRFAIGGGGKKKLCQILESIKHTVQSSAGHFIIPYLCLRRRPSRA